MRRSIPVIILVCFVLPIPVLRAEGVDQDKIITPAGSVALPHVEGRLDHLSADAVRQRLFVAALENHSVEVVDLGRGQWLRSLPGICEPQGLLCLPQFRRLLVCSRGDGTCRSFDLETFQEGSWADLGRNADNVRFDSRSGTVYVGSDGAGEAGALTAIGIESLLPADQGGKPPPRHSPADLLADRSGRVEPRTEARLKSHPESFQLAPDGRRIYANMPDDHGIAVIAVTDQGLKLAATWPVTAGERNFPMAIDPQSPRLFVACRQPARLVCYDTQSGREFSRADCVGDADDLFYDTETGRLYVIGGEGYLDVFAVSADANRLERLARIPTAPRARTGLFLPSLHLICVAAPHTPGREASILLFRVGR